MPSLRTKKAGGVNRRLTAFFNPSLRKARFAGLACFAWLD
jgi:hypothetical protein